MFGAAQPPKRKLSPDPAAAAIAGPKRRAVGRSNGRAHARTVSVLGKRRDSAATAEWQAPCNAKRPRIADRGAPDSGSDSDEGLSGPFARLSVIKMPLALRAQAFLADNRRRNEAEPQGTTATPASSRSSSSSDSSSGSTSALVLYRPSIQFGCSSSAVPIADDAMSID
ncbi:hypothetical protein H4R19_002066 [Coemansia spiralis]|nr:hypothetical protein H4R19_002066 [Coemansia spiralis]